MTPPPKATGLQARRVTWAEDALDDQFLIRQSINQMHAAPEVAFVDDGSRLLEAVAKRRPDLVVLDINMPLMDGLTALRRLRSDPATHDLPAILFSTARHERDVQQARELGVLDFVQKPAAFDLFAQAVAGILRRAGSAGGADVDLVPATRSWRAMAGARVTLRE